MRRRLAFVLLASTLTALTAMEAHADGDAEGAKRHFLAGKKLRDDGDCAKAIAEFEASLAADKSIGAYYNLGFCREQLGSRQDAYDAYKKARDMASVKTDDRLKEISGALAALMETPNIRLVLPNPLPSGTQVYVDGELVPATLYQTELVYFTKARPTHDVRVTAPGYQENLSKVDTRDLKAIELTVNAPPPTYTAQTADKPPPQSDGKLHIRGRHIGGAAAIIGGIGLDAFGIAVIATYATQHARLRRNVDNDAQAGNCKIVSGQLTCDSPTAKATYNHDVQLYDDRNDAWNSIGAVAIGATILGTLAIGTGVYFLLTAPSLTQPPDEKPATASFKPVIVPSVSPTFQGVSLSGTF